MKMQHIYEFSVLARHCNFQDAAKEINVTQATLSRHIRKLESEMGISLFERTTRSVCLSTEGNHFLPYASNMLSLYKEFITELNTSLRVDEISDS